MWKILQWVIGIGLILFIAVGILIPTVSTRCGSRSAEESATKAQYSNYVNALYMFKSEYRTYPAIFDGRPQLNISTYPESEQFIEALSGRTHDGEVSKAHGNYRGIAFHSFSEVELTTSKDLGYRQIADRMGNTNIVVCVDHDGDGMIEVMDEGELKKLRTSVTIYTIPKEGERSIRLWD